MSPVPERVDLDTCRGLLDLPEADLLRRLGATEDDIQRNVRYEKLESVDAVFRPDAFPGRIYLQGGRPQLIYVSGDPGLEGWMEPDLERELGNPEAWLASRAGKAFSHKVYATKGVAYSTDGSELAFLEVFHPRSLEQYERDIYRDPGPFVR